ncbi:glycosyltransferase [Candidatus Azambacteria bacterium]|nr:glycosyltransferase [Candidatus Azambacteria bacterium]
MKEITLSIIITHHQTPDLLRMCIDTIAKEFSGIAHEVIVADVQTQKNTVSMLGAYPAVIFLEEKTNCGFSKAVNRGIGRAKGKFILVINADIIVGGAKGVEEMMGYFAAHRDVGIMGPKLLNTDGSVQQSCFREYTPLTLLARRTSFGKTAWGKRVLERFAYKDIQIQGPLAVDWLMGSAFLMERGRLIKAGGGLDDRFFMYFEDVDLCRRFRRAGMKAVYYPSVVFTHHHMRASWAGGGLTDIFRNWLTRVHLASYAKYLWKWNVEMLFKPRDK